MERWLPVPGFDGAYEVSDLGNVRSLDRTVRGPLGPKRLKGKILKATPKWGYPSVSLYGDGVAVQVGAHILVARAFIGPCPVGQEVCHEDGHPSNPRLTNLRYDTPKGNHADKVKHGTLLRGEGVTNSKLKEAQVRAIKRAALNGVKQSHLAEIYGVSRALICKITRNGLWKHVPAN